MNIDRPVTFVLDASHIWDTGCSVCAMVAPYRDGPPSDVMTSPAANPYALLRLTDYDVADVGCSHRRVRHQAPLTRVLTLELDGALSGLKSSIEELLLAALGRAIARTIGNGVLVVDVEARGRVAVMCATDRQVSASEMLSDVRAMLATAGEPPAPNAARGADIHFSYSGADPWSGFDGEQAGHGAPPLQLRAYRTAGLLVLDWWYAVDQFESCTVDELTEQFPLALIELTSEAVAPI